jgi:hypothetical protein
MNSPLIITIVSMDQKQNVIRELLSPQNHCRNFGNPSLIPSHCPCVWFQSKITLDVGSSTPHTHTISSSSLGTCCDPPTLAPNKMNCRGGNCRWLRDGRWRSIVRVYLMNVGCHSRIGVSQWKILLPNKRIILRFKKRIISKPSISQGYDYPPN